MSQPRKRIFMRSLWEGLEGLQGHQLKLKLLERMVNSADALKKFWSKAGIKGPNECWVYDNPDDNGYGRFSTVSPDRKRSVCIRAHRISFYIAKGYLPEHLMVCHTCDNRACVNPSHFFLGDDDSNKKDMLSKDRQGRGERQFHHKLKDPQVMEIRKQYAAGGITFCEIAQKIGMSYAATRAAIRKETWKHVI